MALSEPLIVHRTDRKDLHDAYLRLLALALAGYALFGRGLAYAGVPPLYVGEMVLVSGLLVLLRSRCLLASLAGLPAMAMVTMMVWVAARTVPNISVYGMDGLRDSVVALYALFAFVIIGVLFEKRSRLTVLFRWYRGFASVYPVLVLAFTLLTWVAGNAIPTLPGSDMPLIAVRAGELSIHLAGALCFVIVGLGRYSTRWLVLASVCILIVGSQSRGGLLAIVVPGLLAAVLVPNARRLRWIVGTFAVLLTVALVTDVSIRSENRERDLSARQIMSNVLSTFTTTTGSTLEDNKQWRLQWWDRIVDYTIHGPYYWSGKGFGPNIAIEDGVETLDSDGGRPLRSPHNIMMTMLARGGVPGIGLWLLVCGTWAGALIGAIMRARSLGREAWARIFVFLLCYWLAIILDALFDVALEGPMVGIWFWTLHGVGIAAVQIFNYETEFEACPRDTQLGN